MALILTRKGLLLRGAEGMKYVGNKQAALLWQNRTLSERNWIYWDVL